MIYASIFLTKVIRLIRRGGAEVFVDEGLSKQEEWDILNRGGRRLSRKRDCRSLYFCDNIAGWEL